MRSTRTRRATAFVVLTLAVATACAQPGASPERVATPAAPSDPLLGPADPATGDTVRVGLFNVEDNPQADLSSTGDAAEAAAAYANEHLGGLDGHRIEVVRCADKIDPQSATACAEEFVRAGVVAVVAGQPTTSDAVLPTTVGAGIPWVGSSPLSPSEIASEDAFFFGSGAVGLLGAYAQYSHDVGYDNVTIYGVESPQVLGLVGTIGRSIFARAGVGMQVVGVPAGGDATARVEEGLADDPDAVLVIAERSACQSVLAALHTLDAPQTRLLGTGCVDQGIIGALGESAIDNAVVFAVGDPSGDHPEAQVYRTVMQQYAPDAEPTGLTTLGYVSMLGFIRAVNSVGLPDGGEVSGEQVAGALREARDVPRPLGNSSTFSCDRSHLAPQLVQATICTSEVLYTTYTAGLPGRYDKIDVGPIYGG
ncbi:ABC transporter substrate-binding protein [Pseudonocardia humida]|uniref:ABC transporter substrate-binding protein n=1 Tax=Pseudonocardia humida TaxID=2800819 RepID=A0ABT1A4D9_9PSEU|nr:ABC transporter substrate-binding protein [Pseudonocardia humida]MCO1657813.1 ABC transporter substrate-binding protein [Pseudonocardia humida]